MVEKPITLVFDILYSRYINLIIFYLLKIIRKVRFPTCVGGIFMINFKVLGKNLKFYRNIRGITLEEMSCETGLSLNTIKEIESGNNCYKLETVNLLCIYLGIDIINLFINSQSEEILYAKDLVRKIERNINHYNFLDISSDVSDLEELLRNSRLFKYDSFHLLIEYYHLLNSLSNNEISITNKEVKKIINKTDFSSIENSMILPIDESRFKMLFAVTYSDQQDYKNSINIEQEMLHTNLSPIQRTKVRLNLAKDFYAIGDFLNAYETTLETIDFINKHSLYDRLQSAYWMKGICEIELNKEFTKSIKNSVAISYMYGLTSQGNKFRDYAEKEFNIEFD